MAGCGLSRSWYFKSAVINARLLAEHPPAEYPCCAWRKRCPIHAEAEAQPDTTQAFVLVAPADSTKARCGHFVNDWKLQIRRTDELQARLGANLRFEGVIVAEVEPFRSQLLDVTKEARVVLDVLQSVQVIEVRILRSGSHACDAQITGGALPYYGDLVIEFLVGDSHVCEHKSDVFLFRHVYRNL